MLNMADAVMSKLQALKNASKTVTEISAALRTSVTHPPDASESVVDDRTQNPWPAGASQ